MLARLNEPNVLAKTVKRDRFQKEIKKFTVFDSEIFPVISLHELYLITLGSYQIKLARSYYAAHIKKNDNVFNALVCPENISKNVLKHFYTATNQPILLLVNMTSRFVSQKEYRAFVLFDKSVTGASSIIGACHMCYLVFRLCTAFTSEWASAVFGRFFSNRRTK